MLHGVTCALHAFTTSILRNPGTYIPERFFCIAENHRILEATKNIEFFFSSQHFCFCSFLKEAWNQVFHFWGRWSSLNLKFAFPLGRWTLKARHMVIFAENEKVLQGCHRFSMVWQSCWAFFGKKNRGSFHFLCSKDFCWGRNMYRRQCICQKKTALG